MVANGSRQEWAQTPCARNPRKPSSVQRFLEQSRDTPSATTFICFGFFVADLGSATHGHAAGRCRESTHRTNRSARPCTVPRLPKECNQIIAPIAGLSRWYFGTVLRPIFADYTTYRRVLKFPFQNCEKRLRRLAAYFKYERDGGRSMTEQAYVKKICQTIKILVAILVSIVKTPQSMRYCL